VHKARVATAYDALRERRQARRVAAAQLGALLGQAEAAALAAEDDDDELLPELALWFDRPVEIFVDCPQKAVVKDGVVRCLFLMEPEEVSGTRYIPEDVFHFVFGRGADCRFFGFGGTWVPRDFAIPAKTKGCSVICGSKKTTRGHRLRRRLFDELKDDVVRFQSSRSPIDDEDGVFVLGKEIRAKARDALGPFRYHVVVENVSERSYFTEKLIDCFLCKTVPVYWGAPDVADFFDTDGIIVVNVRGDDDDDDRVAASVRDSLRAELADADANYDRRRDAIERNFLAAHRWAWNLQDRIQAAVDDALSSLVDAS